MYCSKCGSRVADGSSFCPNCGNEVDASFAAKKTESQNYSTSQGKSFVLNMVYSDNPVINGLKKLSVSPVTLIAVGCFCISVLINLFSNSFIFDYSSEMYEYVYDIFSELDLEVVLDTINTTSFIINLITLLPKILIAVGMCLTIYTVFASREENISSIGLAIINVIYTIYQVLAWISIGLFAILLFLFIASGTFDGALFAIIAGVLIGFIVGYGIRVYYLTKVKETINCIKYSIEYKFPATQIPMLVVVMCFLVGAIEFISCFAGMGAAVFFSAVSNIFFGVTLIKYKTDMTPLRNNPNSTTSKNVQTITSEEAHYNVEEVTRKLDARRTKIIVICVGVLLAVLAVILLIYNNPSNIDTRVVGKWCADWNDDVEITEFKRNGTFIGNSGEYNEERGKYSTRNGSIYITIDGNTTARKYRVKSDNIIEIQLEYWNNYNWETEWVEFYRVK